MLCSSVRVSGVCVCVRERERAGTTLTTPGMSALYGSSDASSDATCIRDQSAGCAYSSETSQLHVPMPTFWDETRILCSELV